MSTKAKTEQASVKCQYCDGSFKGKQGVQIHISKSHPSHSRQQTIDSYQPPSETEAVPVECPQNDPALVELNSKLEDKLLLEIISSDTKPDTEKFSKLVDNFAVSLKLAIDTLPGPKHPKVKYIEAQKRLNTFASNDRSYEKNKNPQKSSKRDRTRRKAKYNYELLQHLFYYSRKKAVRMLMQSSFPSIQCPIALSDLENSYISRWGTPNDKILQDYGSPISSESQEELDQEYTNEITAEEVKHSIKGINNDSASGLDGVYIRIIKKVYSAPVIASIATIMTKWNVVPALFRKARTVLIPKSGGEKADINSWRPISICSIIRRIIERILDSRLSKYVMLNQNQVGFTKHPGTFINTSIVNACLQKAKLNKSNCCIVLLDVVKAFEETSHVHTSKSLQNLPIPQTLRNIVINLMQNNETQVQTKEGVSKTVYIKKGMFQECPLSPQLFNISIDHVIRELTEAEISNSYGFELHTDIPKVSARGFADDVALLSDSVEGAKQITKIAIDNFEKVGYQLNYNKCKLIHIKEGKLSEEHLEIDQNCIIQALKVGDTIKYLGVNFNNEITFDPAKCIQNFSRDLQNLTGTNMLFADQKLKIINQYLWPTLIYPLQCAPLNKLPTKFLEDLDKIVRSSVKEILGIPMDTPNAFLYTSKKYRGLQIVRASWEAFIQHYNICVSLLKSNCMFIPYARDLDSEMKESLKHLGLSQADIQQEFINHPNSKPGQTIRQKLQKDTFAQWCELPQKGAGVQLFNDYPKGNKLILNKESLTTSEWISSMKMSANVYPVRSIPGRSTDGPQCRHCTERETLSHVLGQCHRGDLLRNCRHHEVRSIIANSLRNIKTNGKSHWAVHEEIHCVAEGGSNRRVDIICYNKSRNGFIIDPTIRFERNQAQAREVDEEKKEIYIPCIPYLQNKYNLKKVEVIGLLVGARGTITSFFEDFRKASSCLPIC